MKRALMIIAVAGVAAAPASVTSAAGERELTLEQALDIAKKRNKNMAVDRARLAQVQTTLASAWALLLPNIAAQGRYTRNYAEFNFGGAGIFDKFGVPVIDPTTGFLRITASTGNIPGAPTKVYWGGTKDDGTIHLGYLVQSVATGNLLGGG